MVHHKNLNVWKKSMDFVTEIYQITKNFPADELHALSVQLRRCAVSIPSNIAEGCARFSDSDTLKFLYIAIGSCAEAETQIIIAKNLGYINENEKILISLEEINKMLTGLIKHLKLKET